MDTMELFLAKLGDQKICRWYWWLHHWKNLGLYDIGGVAVPHRVCQRCGRRELNLPDAGWWNMEIVQKVVI